MRSAPVGASGGVVRSPNDHEGKKLFESQERHPIMYMPYGLSKRGVNVASLILSKAETEIASDLQR